MTTADPRIEAVDTPHDGLLVGALPRVDYGDAFQVRLDVVPAPSIDAVALCLLETAPDWVVTLLRVRNAVVRPFGLKTDTPTPQQAQGELSPGDRVGIFRVFARYDDEVLLGEDDRHLDFRVSIRVRRDPSGCVAVMTTVVCFNNWFGRAYFLPVAPFHRVIVPAMMKRGARAIMG